MDRDDTKVHLIDYLIDGLALAIFSNAVLSLLLADESLSLAQASGGSVWGLVANAAVYLFFSLRLGLCTSARKQLMRLIGKDWFFWLPIALLLTGAFFSAIWAVESGVTLRRAVALSGTILVGAYLGVRYTPREFLWLLRADRCHCCAELVDGCWLAGKRHYAGWSPVLG